MKILVTGSSGFIGYHLVSLLLEKSYQVVGIDNMNAYYDVKLKEGRLNILNKHSSFIFYRIDLMDRQSLNDLFAENRFDYVIHLAAQAGVRYSIANPYAYIDSNISGFMNILEACRSYPVMHLIFASSSSVYGGNKTIPFSTKHNVDHPVSLYAATKKSNELMAHAYSHLYGISMTGLRFFTVYGPWGRPDMAYFSFTDDIINDRPIKIFNNGNMERDFTFIDDITEGIYRLIELAPNPNPDWNEKDGDANSSFAPYKIYNLGNSKPVTIERFISLLEEIIGKKAHKEYVDMQPGDVLKTYADISDLEKTIGFKPGISIEEGLKRFVNWYKKYYKTNI